ncbi:alginate export family protein [Gluconacetobacter sacchari]|uniref:alginate export family protein n=1 Tax=Gluconacetobacter sacchari TaxID=92759 RepID=UPI0039B5ADC1
MRAIGPDFVKRPARARIWNRLVPAAWFGISLAGPALADAPEKAETKAPAAAGLRIASLPRPVILPPPASARPTWYGVFGAAKGAASGFGTVAPYGQARWAEDWKFLARAAPDIRRRDWFNRLKYIRLNDNGTIWLSLNGEERLRYVFETQPAMGKAGVTNASRILLRNQYGADLHLGTHVRIYAELLDAVAGGSNTYGYNTGLQRERLDLQQGIFEVRGTLLNAHMGAMGGRQIFLDAPVSMQSARDIPNVQQTWDGFRGYAIWKNFRVDIFDFLQTNKAPVGIFSDGTNYAGRLYGGYGSLALPTFSFMGKSSQLFLDTFFIGYLYGGPTAGLAAAKPGTVHAGSTRRDGVGGRLWGNLAAFTISLTGIYQGGSFRQANDAPHRVVDAFAVNGSAVYSFSWIRGKPSLGVQADVFSGGDYNRTSGSVGTFGTPYFPLPYYNDVTLSLNDQNLVGVGPLFSYQVSRRLAVQFHAPFFWRESTQDAIYGVGRIYAPRSALGGGYIGVEPQLQLAWNFAPHWTWTHDIAGLAVSHALQDAGLRSSLMSMQTMRFVF